MEDDVNHFRGFLSFFFPSESDSAMDEAALSRSTEFQPRDFLTSKMKPIISIVLMTLTLVLIPTANPDNCCTSSRTPDRRRSCACDGADGAGEAPPEDVMDHVGVLSHLSNRLYWLHEH